MEVTLPLWQLLSLGLTVVIAFLGFVFAVWKIVNKLRDQRVEECVASLVKSVAEAREQAADAEREILKLKAALPLDYVRREDWIRNQTIIEAKLDALAAKLENMGGRNGC
ncbi:MAG: hypothetical protein AB7E47_02880 [Desulfovibrionaceae bacterium]